MQNLTPRHGTPVALRALRFLFKRLNASAVTKAIADAVSATRAELVKAQDALEEAELDTECGTAEIEVLDEALGAAFKPLSLALNTLVLGDAHDPRRRILFPKTPSEAMTGTVGPEQGDFVRGVLQVLDTNPAFVTLKLHAPPIAAALDALDAKVKDRDGRQAKEAGVRSAWQAALLQACAVHNDAETKLRDALKTKNKRIIDSYFQKLAKPKKAKAAVEPVPA